MRIAVLISGEPRFCRATTEFMQEAFYNYSSIDWYFSLWKESSLVFYDPARSPWRNYYVAPIWTNIDPSWAESIILKHLPAHQRLVCLQLLDPNAAPIENTNNHNMYRQWYSLYCADLLRQQYEKAEGFKYDRVIRARPDMLLSSPLDVSIPLKDKEILTPNGPFSGNEIWRSNDQFAVGSSDDMTLYSSVVTHLSKYQNETTDITQHPETCLAYHCYRQGLKLIHGEFGVRLRPYSFHKDDGYYTEWGSWAE